MLQNNAHSFKRHLLPHRIPFLFLWCALWLISTRRALAHGISEESKKTMADGSFLDYVWLGAEHMVTGYDHLLFLFGVIFFLSGFKDVVKFITAFTLGHCITLLGATMAGISANAYLIDAVIALSVIYKGFENLDGFEQKFGMKAPNLLLMVFVFGLIHGFGLSTRLQEITLGADGMVSRILAFNVGVELGQIAALSLMLVFFAFWRKSKHFQGFSTVANGGLIIAGAGLFVFQMAGYVHGDDHHDHEEKHHVDQAHEHGNAEGQHSHGEGEHSHGEGEHSHGEGEHSHGEGEHSHGEDEHSHGEGEQSHGEGEHSHGEDEHGDIDKNSNQESNATKKTPKETDLNKAKTQQKEQSHGHSHRHGKGKAHSHGKKTHSHNKKKTHSHGKGKPHSH